ncbi:nuclear transport factor 2 family protein [Terrimonas rubra]|uniref:Nuclear transport factor 2 family protein n=1 Tax=Terrimonas rubra TaxID=1035890 RepID=A0ABW6A4L7_9BACT
MKKITLLTILFCLFATVIMAQDKSVRQVETVVEKLRLTMIDPDESVLNKLASDKLTYGHSSGKVEDKNAFVQTLVTGKSDFVSISFTNQTIQVVGSTAIVRHRLDAATNDGGKPGTVKLDIVLVWVKVKHNWQLLARQAVKVLN